VNDRAPYIVFYVLAAVFVASSLIGRRQLPVGSAAKMALAWVAIFVVAITIAVFLGAYF
jgi:hypothetical protein